MIIFGVKYYRDLNKRIEEFSNPRERYELSVNDRIQIINREQMNYTQTKDLCVSLKRLLFLITLEKSSGSFIEAM